jgi:hypothetical protein
VEELISHYWQQLLGLIGVVVFLYTIKNDTGNVRSDLKAHAEATTLGFRNVNERLDKVNGRLDKTEDRQHDQGERIAKLEG